MKSAWKWATFVLVLIGLKLLLPNLFVPQSVNSMLAWLPLILLLALGQLVVIISGGIDISVGSILGFSAMVLGVVVSKNLEMPIAQQMLICVVVGATLGMVNWGLIAFANIPVPHCYNRNSGDLQRAFIFSCRRQNNHRQHVARLFIELIWQRAPFWGVHVLVAPGRFTVGCCFVEHFALKFTHLGRSIYAYGSQPQSAFRRGISERRVLLAAYCASGSMAGLAGGFYASRFGLVHPGTAGNGLRPQPLQRSSSAAQSLLGGVGSVSRVAFSCLFLAVLNVALSVAGLGADSHCSFTGWYCLLR